MKNTFFIIFLLFSVYFSQAQIVNIPDANFKSALISEGVDTNNDGEIQESEAEVRIVLNVGIENISSLEGIQSFTNLEILICYHNQLSNLDFSQNPNLKTLNCENNLLTSLDVSQNSNLETLDCRDNQLTILDVTQSTNLETLVCYNNQLISLDVSQNLNLEVLSSSNNNLTSLDVSQNANLGQLYCSDNQLTSIDVSQNSSLYYFHCSYNLLTNLDITQNPGLFHLWCNNNPLTSLNIKNGNNQTLFYMRATNNPNLTCIQVDDEEIPNNDWYKDDWAVYSEDCILGITYFEKYIVKIYPNPVKNILYINTELPIDHIKVYTLQGQLINETTNNQIDISLFSSGLYFASIVIDGKNIVKKFIKD